MLLNEDCCPNESQLFNLKISTSFTYLGIKIVPKLENINSINYNAIVESTSKDLEVDAFINLFNRNVKYVED